MLFVTCPMIFWFICYSAILYSPLWRKASQLYETIFWDQMPYSLFADVSGKRTACISRVRLNERSNRQVCWLLASLSLRSWRFKQYVPPKRRWNCAGLHDVTSQTMALVITDMRTPVTLGYLVVPDRLILSHENLSALLYSNICLFAFFFCH
jgi:hypothetical protein